MRIVFTKRSPAYLHSEFSDGDTKVSVVFPISEKEEFSYKTLKSWNREIERGLKDLANAKEYYAKN